MSILKHSPFRLWLPSALLLVAALSARAQEVDATVTINTDQLNIAARQEVEGFGEELERYVDNMTWTNVEWEGEKVPMSFNVVFTGGGDGVYSAKLVVGSQRTLYKSGNLSPMMKILDDDWVFRYVRNQPFQNDPTSYNELSGLIDFYVYVALGLDLDSYGYLGGNSMYEKARDIANRAVLRSDSKGWSTQASPGAYSRYGLIRELLELRYYPIRKFIFDYHYNGLDLIAANRAAALDSIDSYLSDLVRAKDNLVESSTIIRVLNDTKNLEFAELFVGYKDPTVWRKLVFIDPIHQSVYEAAREK
jgi:hypothetical protein